jgi:hypothetical protein
MRVPLLYSGKGDEAEWLGDLHLPDELARLMGTTKVKPDRPHRVLRRVSGHLEPLFLENNSL